MTEITTTNDYCKIIIMRIADSDPQLKTLTEWVRSSQSAHGGGAPPDVWHAMEHFYKLAGESRHIASVYSVVRECGSP